MRYWVPSGRVTTPLVSTRAPLGISWTQDVGIQPAGVAANGSGEASSRVRLPPTNVTRVPAESTWAQRSEEHTSELQSHSDLVCRLLLEKKKNIQEGSDLA